MGGWNKGKVLINWDDKVRDKFGDSFRLAFVGEPKPNGERVIAVECLSCGTIKEVNSISFRGKYSKQGHCDKCNSGYRSSDYIEKLKRQKVEKQIKKQDEKIKAEKKRIGKKLKANQVGLKICEECGLAFIQSNRTYCDDCNIEHHRRNSRQGWRQRDIKRRSRIKSREHDTDITLEKLYERDKGICYLCGKPCDWKDYKIINEAFVVGNSYPSVEHIVALCNGGSHTWDNIKLACFKCNTLKGRKTLAS